MIRFTAEKLLLCLVLLTVAVLIFRAPLLEKRVVIEPGGQGFRLELDSDVQDGGTTLSEWVDKENIEWRCQLGESYDYPFCGMQIYFSDSYLQGLDLTNYTHLNLWLDYEGSASGVRIFLRNSNPAYTKADEIRSTKFNMMELDTRKGSRYEDVQFTYFRVADWWLLLYELEIQHTQIEFTNVGLIEIQTGSGLKGGEHKFKLHRLELVGVHISVESLYLTIIVVWICAILLYLAWRIRMLNAAVKTGKEKQAELTEINLLLDQRSRKLEEKSKLDPLTGAYNRAGIEGALTESFRNWKYSKKPLSLLLLDVDYFKRINDTKGHSVGDEVLRELTALVNNNIRADDNFARWGGEEFIIVCSNTELTQALGMAEKIRSIIDDSLFAGAVKVSVSIGVAQIHEGESLEALFNRTDKALYLAKDNGRNQVKAIGA